MDFAMLTVALCLGITAACHTLLVVIDARPERRRGVVLSAMGVLVAAWVCGWVSRGVVRPTPEPLAVVAGAEK